MALIPRPTKIERWCDSFGTEHNTEAEAWRANARIALHSLFAECMRGRCTVNGYDEIEVDEAARAAVYALVEYPMEVRDILTAIHRADT